MATTPKEWLLVFYSVPAQPVSNRMKIWRKLAKAGAVQLKGAVYILPAGEEHEEFLQWLLSEVKAMGGEGAFVRTADIISTDETDIRELFVRQVDQECRTLEKEVDGLERKIQSIRKGTKSSESSRVSDQALKMMKEFEDLRTRDFFSSPLAAVLGKRIRTIQTEIKAIEPGTASVPTAVKQKAAAAYQGRVWVTRKNPFIDRMASAWLIKRFLDPAAKFKFIDEQELPSIAPTAVAFDMRGGEFTHVGELCTFEVLIKSFGVKDKAVRKIAEIVHDLDVKDEKYGSVETAGIEEVLSGIRKSAKSDADALERGMAVFEMIYQSRTS